MPANSYNLNCCQVIRDTCNWYEWHSSCTEQSHCLLVGWTFFIAVHPDKLSHPSIKSPVNWVATYFLRSVTFCALSRCSCGLFCFSDFCSIAAESFDPWSIRRLTPPTLDCTPLAAKPDKILRLMWLALRYLTNLTLLAAVFTNLQTIISCQCLMQVLPSVIRSLRQSSRYTWVKEKTTALQYAFNIRWRFQQYKAIFPFDSIATCKGQRVISCIKWYGYGNRVLMQKLTYDMPLLWQFFLGEQSFNNTNETCNMQLLHMHHLVSVSEMCLMYREGMDMYHAVIQH